MKSGGIQRDWAGVPRLLYDPNTKQQRCACVKNFGAGLSPVGSKGNNRGDLDHPNLRVFILNVTSYANDYAVTKKRKALSPEDIYQALQVIECDHIVTPLADELEAWKSNKLLKAQNVERNVFIGAQRSEERKRKADKKAAGS
ncbi:hypothetical protein OSTOST_04198 [Ostertagia ostertagi]